jgi:predicted unusual protein kinase regulating ubiquinone biosynthesis (AarF/ABC1/UbiB family)
VAPSLKIRHLPRYSQLARLLVAHRGAWGDDAEGAGAVEDAQAFVQALEEMGPTYVKLGQLLSGRVDLLPPAYIDALCQLHDHAQALPPFVVRRAVEEELGARVTKVFRSFADEPLGAASLAQVHRATLADGRLVAVKVQRPGIRGQVLEDIDVISELAATFDDHIGAAHRAGLSGMVDQFRRALLSELDYHQEAVNLRLMAGFLEPYDRLFTPEPLDDYSTSRLLTMTLVECRSVSVAGRQPGCGGGGHRAEQGAVLANQLFKAYLDQVFVHGVFHADPHPGNVLITDDGRLALVDTGQVARVSPSLQESLLRLLVAMSDGRGPEAADALQRAGERLDEFDHDGLVGDVTVVVAPTTGVSMDQLRVGRQMADLARVSVANGLRPAPELTMLGKALLNLDDVARYLCPDYEPARAVRERSVHIMRHRMMQSASPTNVISAALDAKEFAERLPQRMNKVLDSLAEGKFHLNVDGIDEADIMRSVQKLANRAAAGLAVAAFVLAASIFSISSSGPRWLGESAFTIVLLGVAGVIGAAILLATVRHDLPQRRRRLS